MRTYVPADLERCSDTDHYAVCSATTDLPSTPALLAQNLCAGEFKQVRSELGLYFLFFLQDPLLRSPDTTVTGIDKKAIANRNRERPRGRTAWFEVSARWEESGRTKDRRDCEDNKHGWPQLSVGCGFRRALCISRLMDEEPARFGGVRGKNERPPCVIIDGRGIPAKTEGLYAFTAEKYQKHTVVDNPIRREGEVQFTRSGGQY